MQALERRIDALEKAEPIHQDKTIIIRYDVPGNLGRDILKLENDPAAKQRQSWERAEGESKEDFIKRAKRELIRNKHGVGMLLQCN